MKNDNDHETEWGIFGTCTTLSGKVITYRCSVCERLFEAKPDEELPERH
jgi:hypothetical protein